MLLSRTTTAKALALSAVLIGHSASAFAQPAEVQPKSAAAEPKAPAGSKGAADDATKPAAPSDDAAAKPRDAAPPADAGPAAEPPAGPPAAPAAADTNAGDGDVAPADTPPADGPANDEPAPPAAEPTDAAPAAKPNAGEAGEPEEESDEDRERREEAIPRPPLSEVDVPPPPVWRRRLELGADIALVIRPQASGLGESDIGYSPALAWGLHMNWPVLPWLRLRPYFLDAHHTLDIPQGALVTSATNSISANAQVSEATVESFVFGAKIAPTLDITDRFRVWLSAGIGWGRYEFQEVMIAEPGEDGFRVRERAGTFLEFPVGLGIQVDVWPRWLAIEYEASVAPVTSQSGSAYESAQGVDEAGALRDVGPLGAVELSVVQTLGLSLIL